MRETLQSFCRNNKRIYIYGAGVFAGLTAEWMKKNNMEFSAFIVTKREKNRTEYLAHKVILLEDSIGDGSGFVIAVAKKYFDEIIELLHSRGIKKYYLIDNKIINNENILVKPLRERLLELKYNSDHGLKNNILIYDSRLGANVTFRYRGYNVQQNLAKYSDEWRLVYFWDDELEYVVKYLIYGKIITLLRLEWSKELGDFVIAARHRNIYVIYDIDDYIFDVNQCQTYLKATRSEWNKDDIKSQRETFYNIYLMAKEADGFSTTNAFLAQKLQTVFSGYIEVIPNFINNEQLAIAKGLKLFRKGERNRKNNWIMGYFSGSRSHDVDFHQCLAAIHKLLSSHRNIYLKIVGYLDIPLQLNPFLENGQIITCDLLSMPLLQKEIASVDVNLAPLDINDFSNCKSELKFFEAALVHVVTCASPSYSFKRCITDGFNGVLCQNEAEWYGKLNGLYRGELDERGMIVHAYDYALKNYYGCNITRSLENAYNNFLSFV